MKLHSVISASKVNTDSVLEFCERRQQMKDIQYISRH